MYNITRQLTANILRLSCPLRRTCVQFNQNRPQLPSLSAENNNKSVKYYSSTIQTETNNEPPQPNFAEITNGDKELEHKLKVIMLETEVMRQEGRLVPETSFFKDTHWKSLLKLPSQHARARYLEFLFKIAKKEENRKAKKLEKQLANPKPEKKENITFEEYVSTYDLSHNNIFIRFYDTTINHFYNYRLTQAMQFGQQLVVDCGFHTKMTEREVKNCAKQLMLLFSENRYHDEPFDLHFCNSNYESLLLETLHNHIPIMYEKWFPLNFHTCSYLDVFPKNRLVYLTPHCREELTDYDPDDVYIIGAIVDKSNHHPLSLAKAKKEGLRMAKLPLDRYLQWGSGSGKTLTLNQMISILNDWKSTKNWTHALRHVPRRKLEAHIPEQTNQQNGDDSHSSRVGGVRRWRPAQMEIQSQLFSSRRPKIKDLLDE